MVLTSSSTLLLLNPTEVFTLIVGLVIVRLLITNLIFIIIIIVILIIIFIINIEILSPFLIVITSIIILFLVINLIIQQYCHSVTISDLIISLIITHFKIHQNYYHNALNTDSFNISLMIIRCFVISQNRIVISSNVHILQSVLVPTASCFE